MDNEVQELVEALLEGKNTHMTHVEDRVIYGGVKGTREAIMALTGLRDMFGGYHDNRISVKWDGAPAIFTGTDPSDGRFFVAKKGIFNKNPKVYKSQSDIESDISGDLADKMSRALKHLPKLGIKGVIQGDFLFSKPDLKKKKIHGKNYMVFQPNTIVYAIPFEQAKEVYQSDIGIVWHTTYKGNSFENMKASYGVDVDSMNPYKKVWSQDAMLRPLTGVTLSDSETSEVNGHLSSAGKLFNAIAGSTLRSLEKDPALARDIETFNNTFVRAGETIKNTAVHVTKLISWMHARYQKEIDSKKTEKSKAAWKAKQDSRMNFFSPKNRKSLEKLFELQKTLVSAKNILINKLNDMKRYDTFVKTKKGFKVTKDEGYVVIDHLGSDAVKLVDRLEFSYNNFSPNVIKGWQTATRR